jgi:SAM-dependent methyltransferase
VGVDVNPAALAVAREDVAAAGLEARIELREQSVADVDDMETFDLIWLSQSFLPHEVLVQALPALRRAARPHAALLLLAATPGESGVVGTSIELGHLVTGGGTMTAADARMLLERSGWVEVTTKAALGGVVALARRPG